VGGVISPLLANIYLARLDRVLDAEGVSYVRYADDVRFASRTSAGERHALVRTAEVLEGLGLRLNPQKTKLVSIYQGVDFLGYRLIRQKGHLNVYLKTNGRRALSRAGAAAHPAYRRGESARAFGPTQ
jgi:Reverse transcriptase (RNA-dependent DNA polymerase)